MDRGIKTTVSVKVARHETRFAVRIRGLSHTEAAAIARALDEPIKEFGRNGVPWRNLEKIQKAIAEEL